jgi:hypothetical protein
MPNKHTKIPKLSFKQDEKLLSTSKILSPSETPKIDVGKVPKFCGGHAQRDN